MFQAAEELAARQHAISEYPNEACGLIVSGRYVPCTNSAAAKGGNFRIAAQEMLAAAQLGDVQAIIHSHIKPEHGPFPSSHDMSEQQKMGIPWGITATDGISATPLTWFGDHILDVPLLGREFCPGVQDCYAILRAQRWQEKGIKLPDFARDAEWWTKGGDLFTEGFEKAGFYKIEKSDAAAGDVILMQIRSKKPNHCAVLLDNGLMIHHVTGQLSRREPYGRWLPFVTHWLRHRDA